MIGSIMLNNRREEKHQIYKLLPSQTYMRMTYKVDTLHEHKNKNTASATR